MKNASRFGLVWSAMSWRICLREVAIWSGALCCFDADEGAGRRRLRPTDDLAVVFFEGGARKE